MVTLRHTSPPCRLNKDTLVDCCRLEDVIIVDAVAAFLKKSNFFVTTVQISQWSFCGGERESQINRVKSS